MQYKYERTGKTAAREDTRKGQFLRERQVGGEIPAAESHKARIALPCESKGRYDTMKRGNTERTPRVLSRMAREY